MADRNTLAIFSIISVNKTDSEEIMTTLALSKRQFYDRLSDLRRVGLIGRHKGRYNITSFGRIIYSLLIIAEKAATRYWRLQALDMLKLSTISREDYEKMIDMLLDDLEIKQILIKGLTGTLSVSKPSPILHSSQ
jgi:hypothetical protein